MSEHENDTPGGEEPAALPAGDEYPQQRADGTVDYGSESIQEQTERENRQIIDEGREPTLAEGRQAVEDLQALVDMPQPPDEPITTMADQGIHVPTKPEGGTAQYDPHAPADLEPEHEPPPSLHDVDPWGMRLGDLIATDLFIITRVPGGWLYNETFVPYIKKTQEGAQ